MTTQFRINQRPQQRDLPGAPRLNVTAQRQDYLSAMPAPDAELVGLVKGLSAISPALAGYANQQARLQLIEQEEEDKNAGTAFGHAIQNPIEALRGGTLVTPDMAPPPAMSDSFRENMIAVLANRAGIEMKDSWRKEYEEARYAPDFNAQQWLQQKRAEGLQGLVDPQAQAVVGRHITEFEQWVMGEKARDDAERRHAVRVGAVSAAARDLVGVDRDAATMWQGYQNYLDTAKAAGFTAPEAASSFFAAIAAESARRGGAPELFDVFYEKDAEGMRLVDRNPKLLVEVERARDAAKRELDQRLDKEAQSANTRDLVNIEDMIDNRPEEVTLDFLLGHMGPHGAIKSPQQAASYWARAQEAVRRRAGTQDLAKAWNFGELFRLPGSKQQEVMNLYLNDAMNAVMEASRSGDLSKMGEVAGAILHAHSNAGADVPFNQLKGLFNTLKTNMPRADGPDNKFLVAAALYRQLSQYPQYRDLYFDEDTSMLMENFIKATNGGSDQKSAYAEAYQTVGPEAKKAAADYAKSPDFAERVKSDWKYVSGSSWWPTWLGGNGRPRNEGELKTHLSTALRDWRARHPYATEEQAKAFSQRYMADNFVLDTTTQNAVKVPPSMGGRAAQEAISAHSKRVLETLRLSDRNDGDWTLQYIQVGTEGNYNLVAFNGSATQVVGAVNLSNLIQASVARKLLSPEELQAVGAAKQALAAGQPVSLPPALIDKAEALGGFSRDERARIRQQTERQVLDRIQGVPQTSFGQPSLAGVQPPTNRGIVAVDPKVTGRVAMEFFTAPSSDADTSTLNLAASLVTMGEAVALTAYDDPAKGAGRNIGMGYNLKANEKNVKEDLRMAGVPKERINDVIEGRASLTTEQAKRLLLVSLPRYVEEAKSEAEKVQPGLWARMTPAQRATMIDIAYQVGDSGRFKKAWAAIVNGDQQAFIEQTKVYYTDRAGNKKEDTRRNQLRANMMAGRGVWESTVSRSLGRNTQVAQAN